MEFLRWADANVGTNAAIFPGNLLQEQSKVWFRRQYPRWNLLAFFMTISFLLLAFLGVYNETLLFTIEYRKNFGILKTLGMTPRQLRMPLVWKSLIQMGISLLLSIPLGCILTPYNIYFVVSFIKFSFSLHNISIPALIVIIPLYLVLSALFAWIPSGYILKQKPGAMIGWNRTGEK